MADKDSFPAYRIQREADSVLHLYRDDELVDVDRESDGDTREGIERWGTAAAWAEDHTNIQRWATDGAEPWHILTGIAFRYVTWRYDDDDVTAWDELDSQNWAVRHIEARGPKAVYTAAASLQEVLTARDMGGIDAVRAYEHVYGIAPEAAFPADVVTGLAPVDAAEFAQRWRAAREHLKATKPRQPSGPHSDREV